MVFSLSLVLKESFWNSEMAYRETSFVKLLQDRLSSNVARFTTSE